jgi:hypothetical protein
MNRNTSTVKDWRNKQTPAAALYEVVSADNSSQRAFALPNSTAGIAYVRRMGLQGGYFVPQAGRWMEVSREAALQRVEGLRRSR